MIFAATATAAKAEYTFTPIADSTGVFGDFGVVPSPSLNAVGTVAFVANLDNGRQGVFTGNGGPITTVFTTLPFPDFFGYPSINAAGTVAFVVDQRTGPGQRILTGDGGSVITIADTAGQFRFFGSRYSTSINTAGTVTFYAALDLGPGGIFVNNGGSVNAVLVNSQSVSVGSGISMNDAGTIAFVSGNNTGVFTTNGGQITTIVTDAGQLNYFGTAPSLNEVGTVAFVAGKDGRDGDAFGIYSGNGGSLTTIADISGPFSYLGDFSFRQPSINGSGNVAFVAGLDAGGGGLFIGDGAATSEVIGLFDSLFGSTVSNLLISPTSLNDSGQVAFWYELANGTTGIAVATPVPEPSSSMLLALSLGLSLARRLPRQRSAI